MYNFIHILSLPEMYCAEVFEITAGRLDEGGYLTIDCQC